jgi:moderate conductance mechanosensitive channel
MILSVEKVSGALVWFGPHEFFRQLDERWLADLQDFLHTVLPKIVITLVIAWIFLRVLKLITNRMRRIADGRKGSGVAQLRTLASVTRATGIGIISFLAALEILPLLGFKLEPLLASAGVAGVALGLAAQTIVKDCLNGILILVEDQYNVGDVVKIAGIGGTVEAMSLRKTQLRDGDGTLYIVPQLADHHRRQRHPRLLHRHHQCLRRFLRRPRPGHGPPQRSRHECPQRSSVQRRLP